jgi:hypothetical protein
MPSETNVKSFGIVMPDPKLLPNTVIIPIFCHLRITSLKKISKNNNIEVIVI